MLRNINNLANKQQQKANKRKVLNEMLLLLIRSDAMRSSSPLPTADKIESNFMTKRRRMKTFFLLQSLRVQNNVFG